jgi:hypothetical protein
MFGIGAQIMAQGALPKLSENFSQNFIQMFNDYSSRLNVVLKLDTITFPHSSRLWGSARALGVPC